MDFAEYFSPSRTVRFGAELVASAENGDAAAQMELGWCYKYGQGIAQDSIQAVRWYRKAAEQGHAGAEKALTRLD